MKPGKQVHYGLSSEVWIAIGFCILLFLLNRHLARPWVHANISSGPVLIVVNSIPNLVEAITGTITLSGLMLSVPHHFRSSIWNRDKTVYTLATIVAGVFVFASELNWFTYRGPNVRDNYDLLASALGLIVVYAILSRYGIYDSSEATKNERP